MCILTDFGSERTSYQRNPYAGGTPALPGGGLPKRSRSAESYPVKPLAAQSGNGALFSLSKRRDAASTWTRSAMAPAALT